jgi:hypothetical protein
MNTFFAHLYDCTTAQTDSAFSDLFCSELGALRGASTLRLLHLGLGLLAED